MTKKEFKNLKVGDKIKFLKSGVSSTAFKMGAVKKIIGIDDVGVYVKYSKISQELHSFDKKFRPIILDRDYKFIEKV